MKRKLFFIIVLLGLATSHAQTDVDSCTITSLPYIEDFSQFPVSTMGDNNTFVPCWHRIANGGSNQSLWIYIVPFSHAGVSFQTLCLRTTADTANYSCIILPKIDSTLFPSDSSQLLLHLSLPPQPLVSNLSLRIGTLAYTSDTSSFIPLRRQHIQNIIEPYDIILPITRQDVANRHLALICNGQNRSFSINRIAIEQPSPNGTLLSPQCILGITGTLLTWSHTAPLPGVHPTYHIRLYPRFSGRTIPGDTALIRSYTTTDTCLILRGLTPYTAYTAVITSTSPSDSSQTQQAFFSFCTLNTPSDGCALPTIFRTTSTDTSITAEWFPNADNMSWSVSIQKYFFNSFNTETPVEINYTDSSFTINGLSSGATYKLTLRPHCSPNLSVSQEITTQCQASYPIPFVEDFEHFSPNCWVITQSYFSHVLAFDRCNNHFGAIVHQLCGLPPLSSPVSNLMLKGQIFCGTLEIGVIQNDDPSTFIAIDTVSSTTPLEWDPFVVYFDNYSGNNGRIALRSITPNPNLTYFDNLIVDLIPSCMMPTNVQASVTSTTTATLSWHDTNQTDQYQIEYGPQGFLHGQGIVLNVVNDTAFITGLQHSSSYDAYVRVYCSDRYSEWSYPVTFRTTCGDIDHLPYIENFDNYPPSNLLRPISLPCWLPQRTPSSSPFRIDYYIDPQGHEGNRLLVDQYFLFHHFMLPRINHSRIDIRGTKLTFDAWFDVSTSDSMLIVGVSKDTLLRPNFTPIDTIQLTPQPTRYEVYFNTYTDTGEYIAFQIPNLSPDIFIDNLIVDYIPDCQSVRHFTATHTDTTHIGLSWQPRGSATAWQIAYGPVGFNPNNPSSVSGHTGMVTSTTSAYTLSGLHPATTYHLYIRSLCPSPNTDTSMWSVQPLEVTTPQIPGIVPYLCTFEDSTETLRWQTSSNTNFVWRHSPDSSIPGNHCYQFQTTNGGLGRYENTHITAVLYRDIQFTPHSVETDYVNSFTITFKHKRSTSRHPGSPDIAVFLVPQSTPFHHHDILTDRDILSPNSPYRIATIHPSTDWTTETIQFDTLMGTQRLVFALHNDILGTYTDTNIYIDDINIFPTPCPNPFDPQVTAITDTSVILTWYGDPSAQYIVTVVQGDSDTILTDTAYTNQFPLQGLSPYTTYKAQACRICSISHMSSPTPWLTFTTLVCNDLLADTIGVYPASEDIHSDKLPVDRQRIHSYSQQIFPADSLSRAGTINAINLRLGPGAVNNNRNHSIIYIGHTTVDHFNNRLSFIDPSTLQLVYSGPLPTQQGWNKIVLQTPFEYDGESNLVMAVYNSLNNAKPNYYYCEHTENTTSILLSGNSEIDPISIESLRTNTNVKTTLHSRNQIIFDFCNQVQCPLPKLRKPNLRYSRVTLRWWSSESDLYEVQYQQLHRTDWDTLFTTDTSITINDILPNTRYIYRVRGHCSYDHLPLWSYGTFRTSPDDCPFPEGLHISDIDLNQVSFAWTPDENNTQYRLHIFNSYFDTILYSYVANRTVTNLERGTTYFATISANCSIENQFGDPSDPLQFNTAVCPDVHDLTYSDLQSTSVVLNWQCPLSVTQWEIEYGHLGFDHGYGTSVIADHHPFTLTGLTNLTEYQVYVRSICAEDIVSEHWAGPLTFTTSSINDDASSSQTVFTLLPNPATDRVEVIISSAVPLPYTLSLHDSHGRLIEQSHTPSFSISHLPSGIYYVTLTTSLSSSTRKLVVKH